MNSAYSIESNTHRQSITFVAERANLRKERLIRSPSPESSSPKAPGPQTPQWYPALEFTQRTHAYRRIRDREARRLGEIGGGCSAQRTGACAARRRRPKGLSPHPRGSIPLYTTERAAAAVSRSKQSGPGRPRGARTTRCDVCTSRAGLVLVVPERLRPCG